MTKIKQIITLLCFMILSGGVYAASSSRECAQSEQQQSKNICCFTLGEIANIFPVSSKISTSQEGLFKLGDKKNMIIRDLSGNELKFKYNGDHIEVEYDGKIFSLHINSISICVSDEKAYIFHLMEADPEIIKNKISSTCNTTHDLKVIRDYHSELKNNSSNDKFLKIDRLLEEIFSKLEKELEDKREMEWRLIEDVAKETAAKELIENLRNKYSDDNSTPKEIVFMQLASTNSKKYFENMTREEAFKELKMHLELRRMLAINSYGIEDFKYSISYMKEMEEYKQKGFPEYKKGARYLDSDFDNTPFLPYFYTIELLKSKNQPLHCQIIQDIKKNYSSSFPSSSFSYNDPLIEHIKIFLEKLTESKFDLWSDNMRSITPEFYDFFLSKIEHSYYYSEEIFFKYLEDDDFLSLIKEYIHELPFLFYISIRKIIRILRKDYDFVEKNLNKLFDPDMEEGYDYKNVEYILSQEMTLEEKIEALKGLL